MNPKPITEIRSPKKNLCAFFFSRLIVVRWIHPQPLLLVFRLQACVGNGAWGAGAGENNSKQVQEVAVLFNSAVGEPVCGARGAGARPTFLTTGAMGNCKYEPRE